MTESMAKKPAEIPQSIAALSFEEALAELEKIVRNLEEGKTKLDESVAAYEKGALLRQHCEAKLRDAQLKVEKISVRADGSLALEPGAEE
jgi:exodeoxyribonuclease VII small subunit